MKLKAVRAILCLTSCAAMIAGCGDSDDGSSADSGVCGTAAAPGVLKLSNLSPALGASVVNRNIVHSFTIANAPAIYDDFPLLHGDGHSAGLSTPDDPRFRATQAKASSNVSYEMTIDSWSSASGHVVLKANGSFETTKGCRGSFHRRCSRTTSRPRRRPMAARPMPSRRWTDGVCQMPRSETSRPSTRRPATMWRPRQG